MTSPQRLRPLRGVSIASALIGVLLCLYIGVLPRLPWIEGCLHVWFFDCTVLHHPELSRLLAVPLWVWGLAWFSLMAVVAFGFGPPWLALSATLAGWVIVFHLRGIELGPAGKACALCWLVGLAAIGAGLEPFRRSVPAPRRFPALGLFSVIAGAALMVGALSPPPAEPEAPEMAGWTHVARRGRPLTSADLMVEGPERPTVAYVYTPGCHRCEELRLRLLRDSQLARLADRCRVTVSHGDLADSDLIDEIHQTPAVLFLRDGALVTVHTPVSPGGLEGMVARIAGEILQVSDRSQKPLDKLDSGS